MNDITKVSEITAEDVWEFLNPAEPLTDEESTINVMIGVAKAFIKNYSGLCHCCPCAVSGHVGQQDNVC